MAISEQTYWIAEKAKKYREVTNLPTFDTRRLLYWVGSLPEPERMMPGKSTAGKGRYKKGEVRPFRINQWDYQNIVSDGLVEARVEGLIPWEWVTDGKNPAVIDGIRETKPDKSIYTFIPAIQNIYMPSCLDIDAIPDFDEYIKNIRIQPEITEPQFAHQKYHICVMIEKATAIKKLTEIVKYKYGGDLSVFRGRASVTRINDVINNAKAKNKPIALFYISDCDVAGWDMPKSAFARMNEIYPAKNIIIKVALTREQIKYHNLPTAWDADIEKDLKAKKYSVDQVKQFKDESGSTECVELDALREDIMIQYLEDELEKYAGIDKDNEESKKLNKWKEELKNSDDIKNINIERLKILMKKLEDDNFIQHFDVDNFKKKHDELREQGNRIIKSINTFYEQSGIREFIEEIEDEIEDYDQNREEFKLIEIKKPMKFEKVIN